MLVYMDLCFAFTSINHSFNHLNDFEPLLCYPFLEVGCYTSLLDTEVPACDSIRVYGYMPYILHSNARVAVAQLV